MLMPLYRLSYQCVCVCVCVCHINCFLRITGLFKEKSVHQNSGSFFCRDYNVNIFAQFRCVTNVTKFITFIH